MQSGSVKKALSLKDKEEEYLKVNKLFGNLENTDIIEVDPTVIVEEKLNGEDDGTV